MSTIYDSRAFVKRLTEAGMPEQQADTLASENLHLIAEHLATKEDFRALEAKIEALDAKIDLRLAALKSEIIAKLGGMIAAAVAATATIASIATALIKLV